MSKLWPKAKMAVVTTSYRLGEMSGVFGETGFLDIPPSLPPYDAENHMLTMVKIQSTFDFICPQAFRPQEKALANLRFIVCNHGNIYFFTSRARGKKSTTNACHEVFRGAFRVM